MHPPFPSTPSCSAHVRCRSTRLPWPPITSPRARNACPRKSCTRTWSQKGQERRDAESQPSPGDTAALTSVFQDGRMLEALLCLCFEGGGRGPQTNSASWPCCHCSPQCHPTPHRLFHTPPSQSQPCSASPSACPRGGREGRGIVSKRHGWETKRQEQESRAGRMGLGPKKVELGLRGRRVLRKVV